MPEIIKRAVKIKLEYPNGLPYIGTVIEFIVDTIPLNDVIINGKATAITDVNGEATIELDVFNDATTPIGYICNPVNINLKHFSFPLISGLPISLASLYSLATSEVVYNDTLILNVETLIQDRFAFYTANTNDYIEGLIPEPVFDGSQLKFVNSEEDLTAFVDLRGPQGFSAYQVAVASGFVGSVAEWLESLRMINFDGGNANSVPLTVFKLDGGAA